ncbi:hypothetical protein ACQCU1_12685 [Sutcliffiella horikoshii]|uniref:hypothetical protein n=1 Tax=Sutcliffiella horikoshii TaxID=79883 RepID=UPI003CF2B188
MNIRISSTNVRYSDEGEVASVQVHFSGHDEQRTINVNGYIPLTAEEYNGNESITALTILIKANLAARLAA